MKNINLEKDPYFSRITNQDYTQILYKPGEYVQTQELNTMQLMSTQKIKDVADTILTDGDILSGTEIIINNKKATITDGKIYLDGVVRHFKEQSVPITGIGSEIIGVKLDQEIITSDMDDSLLSPAAGFENYKLSGADRLKETVILVLNDEEATPLYVLENGNLIKENKTEDGTIIEKFNTTLARRTYDESGHYKTYGLELSQKQGSDENYLYLSLSEGKAYVEGWEIEKAVATNIPIERSKETRTIIGEPKSYTEEQTKYKLNNNPVKLINRVTAAVSVSTTMTRQGSINGTDPIQSQYTPVIDIQAITQVPSDVTYSKNKDFVLEGNTVRWLDGGKQPNLGDTYNITFTYNKKMTKDTDYKLTVDHNMYYLEILSDGDKPVENSQILIDYEFYLHYIATISLDKQGKIRITKGQSDVEDKVSGPSITDTSVLVLGHVHVVPMNDILKIVNTKTLRSSMNRIQQMYERIEDMELNQAITDLDEEALEGEQASLLKGIYTDGFIGWTKADIDHPEYNASINPTYAFLTMGFKQDPRHLIVNNAKTTAHITKRLGTGKSKEIEKAKQPYATESHLINPYTEYPQIPSISISPSVDNWIDTENVVIEKNGGTVVKTNTINRTVDKRTKSHGWIKVIGTNTNVSYSNGSTTSKDKTVSTNSVIESAIEYMREIEITVKASQFRTYQQGIVILFNGVEVKATPTKEEFKNVNGFLQANEFGEVEATIKVPKNTRCGTVGVEIYADEFKDRIGGTTFTANGVLKKNITTNTTTTYVTKTVYKTTTYTSITRNTDPLSQTFSFDKDQMLTSLDLYFSHIEEGHDVRVQIRETENGYPSNVILSEKYLKPSDISTSSDSSEVTHIVLDDPVYCEADTQYAFTVLTTSNKSALYDQELGKRDLLTKEYVAKNPYIDGLMFSSSNALSWTAHQTKNIKFILYCNDYEDTSEIYFNQITGVDYDKIQLLADTNIPIDCSLTWEYSTDNQKTWLPLPNINEISLAKSIDNIIVRAILKTTGNVSPAVALDSLLLVGYKNLEHSSHVSRNITLDNDYKTVKIVADVDAPSGTGVVFYYATDIDGKEWKALSQDGDGKVKIEGSFIEYTYLATLSENAKNFRFKIDLTTNDSAKTPLVRAVKCILK